MLLKEGMYFRIHPKFKQAIEQDEDLITKPCEQQYHEAYPSLLTSVDASIRIRLRVQLLSCAHSLLDRTRAQAFWT